MKIFVSLTRFCAAALIAAPLAFAATGMVHAAPAPTPVTTQPHGVWQGFAETSGSDRTFGAASPLKDGSTAVFVVGRTSMALFVMNEKWTLPVGTVVPVKLSVDGAVYSGKATVRDEHSIEFESQSIEMVKSLAIARTASLDLGNGTVVWQIDLDGFTPSLVDASNLNVAS